MGYQHSIAIAHHLVQGCAKPVFERTLLLLGQSLYSVNIGVDVFTTSHHEAMFHKLQRLFSVACARACGAVAKHYQWEGVLLDRVVGRLIHTERNSSVAAGVHRIGIVQRLASTPPHDSGLLWEHQQPSGALGVAFVKSRTEVPVRR